MTINDLLWDSVTLQGHLLVTRYNDRLGKDIELYDDDAESIDTTHSWCDVDISYIYPYMHTVDKPAIHIELLTIY